MMLKVIFSLFPLGKSPNLGKRLFEFCFPVPYALTLPLTLHAASLGQFMKQSSSL